MATNVLAALHLAIVSLGIQGGADSLLQQARAAADRGDIPGAMALATRAIGSAPTRTDGWLLRAGLFDSQGEHAKAVADYGAAIRLDPNLAAAWQRRGEARFRMGRFAESVADFDHYLDLVPSQKPHNWQRGISLYYAGRFADGKRQFELHQTVNPHDVENAVWHYLCTARAEGLSSARKSLIPISGDSRVPMAQIHALFAGAGSVEDVLKTAREADTRPRAGEATFYADLYLGLYYEAVGEAAKAEQHIRRAASRSKENGYMGDVARVHAERMRNRNATGKKDR